jgi:hypothetical protein
MPIPANPKIYHIVHVDKLASIVADGCLWSDAELVGRNVPGTVIGMNNIKERRMNKLTLASHPGLFVGQCVPFYFCRRSIMLFMIHMKNESLSYRGGQDEIVHLVADLQESVAWAQDNARRWAFTLSNAGACDFEDRANLGQLAEVNWDAVEENRWSGANVDPSIKRGKQAEFLVEHSFPWHLIKGIATKNDRVAKQAAKAVAGAAHQMTIKQMPAWYY